MEEYLKETYGITVYQEQVMLLSQKLANFSKGEANVLRKAMGKKIFALLQKLKPQFVDGAEKNGHAREILEKIWKDWEAFASLMPLINAIPLVMPILPIKRLI